MANEYRFTKAALEVLARAANPEVRIYSMGIEVLRSITAAPTNAPSSRMNVMS